MSNNTYNENGLERFVRKHTPGLLIFSGISLGAAATVMYRMDPETATTQFNTALQTMYAGSIILTGGGIIEGVGNAIKNYREKKQKP